MLQPEPYNRGVWENIAMGKRTVFIVLLRLDINVDTCRQMVDSFRQK